MGPRPRTSDAGGRRRAKDSTRCASPASCDTAAHEPHLRRPAGRPDRTIRPLRIVDVRWYLGRPGDGRVAYDAGHIPGAIYVDLDTDLRAPEGPGRHPLPDPAVFAERLGELGIGSEHEVVVVRRRRRRHRRSTVVDARRPGPRGRSPCWTAGSWRGSQGGHPVEIARRRTWPAASLHLRDRWTRVIDRDAPHGPARRRRPARCARGAPAIGARWSRWTRSPGTSRPPGTRRPTATSGRMVGSSPPTTCAPASNRSARARRDGGRHVLRQRRDRLPQRARDAARRTARPDPLPRVLERLEHGRLPGRDGPGTRRDAAERRLTPRATPGPPGPYSR